MELPTEPYREFSLPKPGGAEGTWHELPGHHIKVNGAKGKEPARKTIFTGR